MTTFVKKAHSVEHSKPFHADSSSSHVSEPTLVMKKNPIKSSSGKSHRGDREKTSTLQGKKTKVQKRKGFSYDTPKSVGEGGTLGEGGGGLQEVIGLHK